MTAGTDGLIYARVLDGAGGAKALDWAGLKAWDPADGVLWVHLDHESDAARAWLADEAGVEAALRSALLADDPRPRSLVHHDRLLLILRGINTNAGASPEDMVSIRALFGGERVITMRHRRVAAVADMVATLDEGEGPVDVGTTLYTLVNRMLDRIGELVGEVDEEADGLEDAVLEAETHELRPRLAALRRQSIALRRYLAPQRDTIVRLQGERVTWLGDPHRAMLREAGDRVTRYLEDLDSARDRAAVTHEELASRLSDQMNRTMYVLSIVATIFLPLGLITGLLGINVGGIPGADADWAFAAVSYGLVFLAVVLVVVFRRVRLF